MRRKFFLAGACFILLTSCLKDIDLSGLDDLFTSSYIWTSVYTGNTDSLTSNKTFKMKVLEVGTNQPVAGSKLKFYSNGYTVTDSLIADANGDMLITGRNVAPSRCLLSHADYWWHGTQYSTPNTAGFANMYFNVPRIDSIYRMQTVDSIVTYMYALSYAKLHVSSSTFYETGSYGRFYLSYLKPNGELLSSQEFFGVPINKDTTVSLLLLANQPLKISVSVRKPNGDQIRFVETTSQKAQKKDTAYFDVKL